MDDRPIVVFADSALFDLGVTVGFVAVVGGFLAVALYSSALFLWDRITSR